MTPDRYHRVTELFDAARELPAAEREQLLLGTCNGDADLLHEVQRLLIYHDNHPDFLNTPVITAELRQEATDRLLQADDQLLAAAGRWRLQRLVGEGGFARVYLGEQQSPYYRKAAIKVLRQGAAPRTVRRLQAECQALALLNHSGIVGIIEAGQLDDGSLRPYVVMEFVDGEAITAYCRRTNLGLKSRINLFLNACDAVQHAHLRGILHRDLKASNVMVTEVDGAPVVKIVDFGVAKALDDTRLAGDATITCDGELVGTLGYMSPEQLDGRADVRADVYALGALLYELCTGRLPIDVHKCGIVEAARRIKEQAIEPASKAVRDCRGDLDVILATALAKDADRRYQSAGELAADLRRYLSGETILAREPTLSYLLHRYTRRHRAAFATSLVALVVFAIGAVLLVQESFRARSAEDRLARRVHATARDECTKLSLRVGTVDERARKAAEAYSDAQELLARRPNEAEYLDLMAEAARQVSIVALERGDAARALECRHEALVWRRKAAERDPANQAIRKSLAIDLVLLGDSHSSFGRLAAMRDWYQQSLDLTAAIAADEPTEANRGELAWAWQRLAAADLHAGHLSAAFEEANQSLQITDEILARSPDDASALGCARQTHAYLVHLNRCRENKDAEEQHAQLASQIAERLYQLDPQNRDYIVGVLNSRLRTSDRTPEPSETRRLYQQGYELAVSSLRDDPHHHMFLAFSTNFAFRLGSLAHDDGDDLEAARLCREAVAYVRRMPGRSADDIANLVSAYWGASKLFRLSGCLAEQHECERQVRSLSDQLAHLEYSSPEQLRGAAEALLALGGDDDKALAIELAVRALDRTESAPTPFLQTLAHARAAVGDFDEALSLLNRAAKLAASDEAKSEIASQITALRESPRP